MTATITKPTTPAAEGEPQKRKRQVRWRPWLWLAPALILLGFFLVWPVIRTIWISFHSGSIINPTREFVGLENYQELFTNDPAFIKYGLPPWSARRRSTSSSNVVTRTPSCSASSIRQRSYSIRSSRASRCTTGPQATGTDFLSGGVATIALAAPSWLF